MQASQQTQDTKRSGGDEKKKDGPGGNNNKPKPSTEASDLDGPKEVRLEPSKLCRPEDPLSEARKFLEPLQIFASNRIETHLFSFEIYYRLGFSVGITKYQLLVIH